MAKDRSFLAFLKRLFKQNPKIGILILRGGLGNQLYQISALAYYSTKYEFYPIIYDFDVRSFGGTSKSAEYSDIGITDWFRSCRHPVVLRGIWELLLRAILSFNRRWPKIVMWNEKMFEEVSFNKPMALLICDSFQNCKYPLALPKDFHKTFFSGYCQKYFVPKSNEVSIHIRLTDFLPEAPFDYEYYSRSINDVSRFMIERIDCFSDDIPLAKSLLAKLLPLDSGWPEDKIVLSPQHFLHEFSQYSFIIASRSSLCWWASFIAWKQNPNLYLIHPWDEIEDFTLTNRP
jgi:hypothetical protein